MKCLGVCIPVVAIVLMVSQSAFADRYVVYGGSWQDPAQAPADIKDAPIQAPADMKDAPIQAPAGGCGCGQGYSSCGDCGNGCSGWWSGYCRTRHHHFGHHRRAGCYSGCDMGCTTYDVGCGSCGGCFAGHGCGCGHRFRLHHHHNRFSCYDSCWDDMGSCGCGAGVYENGGYDKGGYEGKSDLPTEAPPAPMPDEAPVGPKSARFGRFLRW